MQHKGTATQIERPTAEAATLVAAIEGAVATSATSATRTVTTTVEAIAPRGNKWQGHKNTTGVLRGAATCFWRK